MHEVCPHCSVLTSDQRAQLAIPSYKLNKEKCCSKADKSDKKDTENDSTQIDLATMSVLDAVIPPTSRTISQETLRKWEKASDESSNICNQVAGFNRCLNKVQENMQTQLKIIRTEQSKDKLAGKVHTATDELQCLMNFNQFISQAMAKTMEHLLNFVFTSMANVTLARRYAYLSHVDLALNLTHSMLSAQHLYTWPPSFLTVL